MRDYIKSIRTNWIWCTRYILPRQQLQRQNTRIELTTKAKKVGSGFFEIKEVSLREKTVFRGDKKRMTFICGLAIILPIYAIQNQEMPEVEMFCRHTIGGYHFDFYHRSLMYHFLLSFSGKLLNSLSRLLSNENSSFSH